MATKYEHTLPKARQHQKEYHEFFDLDTLNRAFLGLGSSDKVLVIFCTRESMHDVEV
ncbi:hypothetical protein SMIDD22_01261 [Streptococcus mitis]|uniref:Uncharacterized protein n=1 Tax=Streptococcus mitis TaxID=28037 RepID=A0A139RAL4_STRMT|nr:hypothetical protein SMIDD22_01261 [Streptococcus mitis]